MKGLLGSDSVTMHRGSTSNTPAHLQQRACGALAESRRPFEAGVKASLHTVGPSMLLALYHDCSPAGECVAIDQQLARFAQPLIRWQEREGSSKQEKRGWRTWRGGGGGRQVYTSSVGAASLCGRNKRVKGEGVEVGEGVGGVT